MKIEELKATSNFELRSYLRTIKDIISVVKTEKK